MDMQAPRIDHFLRPGDVAVGDARFRLRTLLGSCVSVTLWHPQSRVGAMSHFLLPSRGTAGKARAGLDGRYGDEALQLMLASLARHGIAGPQCVARIFGGGNMFPRQLLHGHAGEVGRRNGEKARELLQQQGIAVQSEHLFGVGHRRIELDVASGEVLAVQVGLAEQRSATSPAPLNCSATLW